MNEIDIDALFDQADAQLQKRPALLDSPRYASDTDFANPYIIVVHENQIPAEISAGNLRQDLGARVLQQISEIKERHPTSWTKGSPFFVPSKVPRGRPILVCGVFEDVCVGQQYDKLIKAGYGSDAYISRTGVLPLSSLN